MTLERPAPKASAAASAPRPTIIEPGSRHVAFSGPAPGAGERLLLNEAALALDDCYPDIAPILDLTEIKRARRWISNWPGYQPAPFQNAQDLAAELGVRRIWLKNESERFGLGSFKPLGGAYAVSRIAGSSRASPSFVTASDGNHGLAVAWGAKRCGCRCTIFLPQRVPQGREMAIREMGAEIIRFDGDYDGAVVAAARYANEGQHTLVADTSAAGGADAAALVMQGYGSSAVEVIRQLPGGELPSHVFVQAGVGGFAAAIAATFWQCWGVRRPMLIIVEPTAAACFLTSVELGRRTSLAGDLDTTMTGLACGEPSPLAWEVLSQGAQAFISVTDERARGAARLLGASAPERPSILASPSGSAGLAGLILAVSYFAAQLGINDTSKILLFCTGKGDAYS